MNYFQLGKVANPKLSLYAFHLRYNLAQGANNQVDNANHLWLKCQEIGKKIGIPKLEDLSKLIDEQNPQTSDIDGEILPQILSFTAIAHKKDLHLRGEINPLKIHDTYAVDLTLRYPAPEVQLADLHGLNPNNYLLPQNIQASLGQSLVFFAKPLGDIEDEQAFANSCVTALLSAVTVKQLQIYCQSQGRFLGSSIYEYNNDAIHPQEQCHILIWLNTNDHTTKSAEEEYYYSPLIDLLLCRSKIIYAWSEAIWCNQQARENYSKLENKAINFNFVKNQSDKSKLATFSQWLNEIPEVSFNYARYLRDLELQKITIKTNSTNYYLFLSKLETLKIKDDDLQFLSEFGQLTDNTFIEQINTDLAYLTPGQSLFDQMINNIRGIVEIEQAQRDRHLENTIQILGVGFGGGAIASGVIVSHIDKINQPLAAISPDNQPHPFYASLFLSFLAVLFFCGVGWLITKWRK